MNKSFLYLFVLFFCSGCFSTETETTVTGTAVNAIARPVPLRIHGFYTNEKSEDGQHSTGYTMQLWRYAGEFVGALYYNEGALGNHIKGELSRFPYTTEGDLLFQTELDGKAVTFKGTIEEGRVSGAFIWVGDHIDVGQKLQKCCENAETHHDFESLRAWRGEL